MAKNSSTSKKRTKATSPRARVASTNSIATFSIKPGLMAILAGVLILIGGLWVLLSQANTAQEKWYVLPIRSHNQWNNYNAGDKSQIGGEGMQYPRSMVRSKSDPNVIYMGQDVGAVWKSLDGGTTWHHTVSKGLNNDMVHSIAVDPVNPKKVFVLAGAGWDATLKSKEGLYISSDGGDNWGRSLAASVDSKGKADYAMASREHQENIAYDPASIDTKGAKVWYAAVDCGYGTGSDTKDCYLYKSQDYGTNWSKIESTYLGAHGEIHNLVVNSSNGQVYFSSSNGLYKSSNGGANFTRISNGIPSGDVGWVVLDPKNPNKIYVIAVNKGLYVSDNAGTNYTLLKSHDKAMSVFVNSSNPNSIYLLSNSSSNITEVSSDGGITWSKASTPSLGYLHDYWPRKFADDKSAVLPDPRDPNKAIAHYNALIFKTVDGGKNWSLSSNLFAGHGCNKFPSSINFDPKDSNTFGFFCYDFGMTYTVNGGGSFDIGRMSDSFVKANDIENKHIYTGSIKPGSGGKDIVASGGDKRKIIRSTDGGKNWSIINFNFASVDFVRHHPTDGQTVYAGRWISRDGGNTFQFKKIDPNSDIVTIVDASKDGNSLLATEIGSARNIWRSKDKGSSWQKVASFGHNLNSPGRFPVIAIHPTDNNIFYYREVSGDIAKYDIAQSKPTSLKLKANNPSINTVDNSVNTIAIDPTRPEVIYVHTTMPGTENVWRSLNSGASWESIAKNLPRVATHRLAVNPHTGDLFSGSMIGNWVFPRPSQFSASYAKPSITSTNKVVSYNDASLPSTSIPPTVSTPVAPTNITSPPPSTPPTSSVESIKLSETSTGPYYEFATIKLGLSYSGTEQIVSSKLYLNGSELIQDNSAPFDSFTVGGAKAGSKQYYVVATTSSGKTIQSNQVNVTVKPPVSAPPTAPTPTTTSQPSADVTAPSAPAGVKASVVFDPLRFSYYINLKWSASYDAVGPISYQVKRNGTSLGTSTTTSFKDYNLQPNTHYTYEVFARDAAGNISLPGSDKLTGRCFLIWCWGE